MELGKLNHVAIAVPDLSASTDLYKNVLGASCSEPQDLPEHGVTTVFVNLGNTKLELLGLLGEKSPIAKFLEKNPVKKECPTRVDCRVHWTGEGGGEGEG